MVDSMTVLVALFALCMVTTVLIWQIATLSDSVNEVKEDVRATARRLARMDSYMLTVDERKEDGGHGDED